jgi:hypothetical protein
MKLRRLAWLALLPAACIAGFLWHYWSPNSTCLKQIIVGRDSVDAAVSPAHVKSRYDFYFDRVNHSTDFVFSGAISITPNP